MSELKKAYRKAYFLALENARNAENHNDAAYWMYESQRYHALIGSVK